MRCNGWVIASFMANQTFDLCENHNKTLVDAFVTATVWNLKEGYNRPYSLSFYLPCHSHYPKQKIQKAKKIFNIFHY